MTFFTFIMYTFINTFLFTEVIFYGNQQDLTLQKRSLENEDYVFSSDTVVITAKDQTYTALFPHSGKIKYSFILTSQYLSFI